MIALLICAAAAFAAPVAAMSRTEEEPRAQLAAGVDARVELMSLIFRLAGNPEYNQPNGRSPYTEEVDAYFEKYREHPVVALAQDLRKTNSVSYDAVMSMATHIADTKTFGERIPFDKGPERLDRRWPVGRAREFLEKARSFVAESEFNGFFERHKDLYDEVARRMVGLLEKRDYIGWFDGYFGARPAARFCVIVGMLNGPCNYGAGIRFPDGSEEITPVIGTWMFDEEGCPIFDDSVVSTIVHEFCHTYTNSLVDRHAEALRAAGETIFPRVEKIMHSQAYSNWRTMMYESLVRVCVVRFIAAQDGADAAFRAVRYEQGRGFYWTKELSELLAGEFEADRGRYPAFADFMPRVVAFFDGYAARYKGAAAAVAPEVIQVVPPIGAAGVDPGLTEIKVQFSIPMRDGCWAVCGGGPELPEMPAPCFYDAECKVLTIPVRLEPNRTYRFWLNAGEYMSFQSRDGVPLLSTEVNFATGARNEDSGSKSFLIDD